MSGGSPPTPGDDPLGGQLAHRLNNAATAILTSLELLQEELSSEAPSDKLDRERYLVLEAIAGVERLTEVVGAVRGLSWGAAQAPAPEGSPTEAEPRRRVLVVDDEPFLASGIARVLDGADVVTAGTGREALDVLGRDTAFDVVLCDLVMSDLGGMDVHTWLAQHAPALAERTIFMTAGAFTDETRAFLARTTNPVLRKPFDARTLRWMVAQSARRAAP
jgi:CheY-like chemotaxis protein